MVHEKRLGLVDLYQICRMFDSIPRLNERLGLGVHMHICDRGNLC